MTQLIQDILNNWLSLMRQLKQGLELIETFKINDSEYWDI